MDPAGAVAFAVEHDLVSAADARAVPLGGGVSNDTILVEDGHRRVVVKRALGRLRTAAEWYASPTRALAEAAALRLAAGLTPDRVPAVLAADPVTATIAVAAAPPGWRDWKGELLAGTVRPAVGAALGATLAAWHAAGRVDLSGMDRMEALRIVPFHETIAARHRDLAGPIGRAVTELRERRLGLVHGDFSPKNVLVPATGDRLWVIDFEVAHLGNPVFDLAFLQAHLLLKAVARGQRRLHDTAVAFLAAYRPSRAVLADLPLHTGCLVLSRVDGTSPVEYLDGAGAERARRLGRRLVAGQVDLDGAWEAVWDNR